MLERTGVKWSREETILAFELYCRTPFSKISKSNREIIELAELLGRTPSSVGLKLANLAHHDPEIKRKELSGMPHGSKLDEEICNEFYNNWEELSLEAQKILSMKKGIPIERMIGINDEIVKLPPGRYRDAQIKQRVGQSFFRRVVLSTYSNRCCITKMAEPSLLIASHIKPWNVSDEKKERTNPRNGLCLNVFHDKVFDKGFITINRNYEMVISSHLKKAEMDKETKVWIMKYDGKKINLPDKFLPDKQFIGYHNDVVFLH